MGTANYIGRVGAWTVALGIRNVRHTATRVTVSIGVAILVVTATVVSTPIPTVSPGVKLSADSTALILGGSSVPTPDDYYIETVKSHLLAPTHPGQNINYVAVTAPMEVWPLTGIGRLVWLALGPPSIWGPGGPGWPDEPWWKLSGLFDLTIDQSVRAGVADLEQAMAAHGNDNLVIYGYSQGAMIANREKRKLAEQYPEGTKAPDIDFVLSGDPNVPNGGLLARFPGLYVPILDLSFNGPEPTDTPFHTDVITRQYDGLADFPLYPINGVSLLNAVLGVVYVHPYDLDVSLPADPTKSPAYQGTHGDTSYYFFQNPDLPLFAPLRTLGVPESLIDVVEPFFRVLVELGYDRSIPPWEPTPARLIPTLDPAKVATDLVNAIGEGVNNVAALVGSPPPLSLPAPVTLAAPGTETAKADIPPQVTSKDTPTQTEQMTSTGAATGAQQMSMDMAPSTPKVTGTANADVSRQVTPTERVSETGQVTSATRVIETAQADEASAGPSAAKAPEASADVSTLRTAKPVGRPAAPRRVVRGSPESGEQQQDLPHRVNGDQRTTGTSHGAATAGPSSVASPAASSPKGSNSSGGDAGDS
jgi:pimeloyl-ACP methyl ester carboxylesterase